MTSLPYRRMALNTAAVCAMLGGMLAPCAANAQARADAVLSAAPAGQPATSRQAELHAAGYVETEYFLEGRATSYDASGDWGEDGRWAVKVKQAGQPYATRLLVRRPADPARFNGIVLVEWLNTTLGFDMDGGWMLTRDEIEREGYAWVGVSVEKDGIEGLQKHRAQRYAASHIAANELAYDIYSQAGNAVRRHAAELLGMAPTTPGPGTAVQAPSVKLLAMAYSQSGTFFSTYINAIQLQDKAYDGFFMHGTAPMAAPIASWTRWRYAPHIRADLNVPVMQLQTEMEAVVSWPLSKTPDTDKIRYWEVPGAAHFGKRLQEDAQAVAAPDFRSATPDCFKPVNTLPVHEIDDAALHALRQWVTAGTPPPKAPRMERSDWGFLQYDELGNAKGGLRLPEISVPTARYGMYSNYSWSSVLGNADRYKCVAGGSAVPLTASELAAMYGSPEQYFTRYKAAADALLAGGFLRPADHAQALQRAKAFRLAQ